MKIVIMEDLGISPCELREFEKPFIENGVEFVEYEKTTDKNKLIEEGSDADVIIIANMPMPDDVIRGCKKLKFIDVTFTGVDHVGLTAAEENDVKVSNASGYSNEAVSELVIGMALSFARNIHQLDNRCREGKDKSGLLGWEIKDKIVGIIGLGRIGTRTAELFHALGADILANSRSYHNNAPSYINQVALDELLRRSDIVILHCPLNDSTKGLMDKANLEKMKKTSLLINVARGPVVVESDLINALENGTIAGACIDVFDIEPPLGIDSPILKAPHCILTPHVAFATKESMSLRAKIVFDNLAAWMDGRQQNIIL